jgi:hypothetical protein
LRIGNIESISVDDNYFHYLTSHHPHRWFVIRHSDVIGISKPPSWAMLSSYVVVGHALLVLLVWAVQVSRVVLLFLVQMALWRGSWPPMLGDEHAFPDRLRKEIEAIVHRHTPGWRVKVTSPNVSERAICSWLGGSILGVWCCNCESKVPIVIGVGRSFFEPRVSYAPECL